MPLRHLLANNRAWSEQLRLRDADFFPQLARQQSPKYLWIGCSDSRVPANEIVGLLPGELFVHRNVANIVVHTDLNCLTVTQFAIDVLKVEHVIVCGHYGCSGVRAALKRERVGLSDNWLRHVQDVEHKHQQSLAPLSSDEARADRLCELNVVEQAMNVCGTTIVRDAWARGQRVLVHGWIYGLADGLVHDLGVTASSPDEAATIAARAARAATRDAR
jgi:carbonic anhydrase